MTEYEEYLSNLKHGIDRTTVEKLLKYYDDVLTCFKVISTKDNRFVIKDTNDTKLCVDLNEFNSIPVKQFERINEEIFNFFDNYKYTIGNTNFEIFKRAGYFYKGSLELILNVEQSELENTEAYYDMSKDGKFIFDDNEENKTEFFVSEPSDLFKFINNHFLYDKNWTWDEILTLKINNVSKTNYEEYLNYSLFYLNHLFQFPFNEKITIKQMLFYEDQLAKSEYSLDKVLKPAVYFDYKPVAYFNKGIIENNTLAFYNVLEFYFQKREQNTKGTEEESLKALLDKLKKHDYNAMEKILNKAKTHNLIEGDVNVDNFCTPIYEYRNAITHSKNEQEKRKIVPTFIPDYTDVSWQNIFKELAELTIQHLNKK